MAFCKNCGTELKEGAIFCKNCGWKLGDDLSEFHIPENNIYGKMPEYIGNTGEQQSNNFTEKLNDGKDWTVQKTKTAVHSIQEWLPVAKEKLKIWFKTFVEKCKRDKKFAIITGAAGTVVVVCFVLTIVFANMSKKVNIKDCFDVEFYGYEGNGYAEVSFDQEVFNKKIMDAIGKKRKINTSVLSNCIHYDLKNDSQLSNGDTITLKLSYNNDRAKEYKIKFVGESFEYKVKGLDDLIELDPFENLSVSFEGISPNMELYYDYIGEEGIIDEDMFHADQYEDIAVGDVITISLDISEYDMESNGYQITQLSKEYECTEGSSYLTDLSQLSSGALEEFTDAAEDCINAFYADQYEYISCENLDYKGSYLLIPKGKDNLYDNILYIVIKGTVLSNELDNGNEYFKSTTVFMPIGFENIVVQEDDSVTYELISSNILGNTGLPYDYGWSSVPGYLKLDSMYNELVGSQLVSYTYEMTENLEGGGQEQKSVSIEDDEYVLPTSDSEYLSANEINKLSAKELRLARNEIYARHGYIFEDEELKEYFESKSWYSGSKKDIPDSQFNDYEIANRDLIIKAEKKKK